MKNRNFGFSLIELMVVIAIVSLLAAVAVPTYAEFINRSKVAEVHSLVSSYLNDWAEKDALGGAFVERNITGTGSYIEEIEISSSGAAVENTGYTGMVYVAFKNPSGIDGVPAATIITYTPTVQDAGISWTCNYRAEIANTALESILTNCARADALS